MKARVKATGEIIDVQHDYDLRESTVVEFYTNIENPKKVFEKEDLEFLNDSEFIDYWTRLEHQYAGMAMQGMCANYTEFTKDNDGTLSNTEMIVENARLIAHALVEKMKKGQL